MSLNSYPPLPPRCTDVLGPSATDRWKFMVVSRRLLRSVTSCGPFNITKVLSKAADLTVSQWVRLRPDLKRVCHAATIVPEVLSMPEGELTSRPPSMPTLSDLPTASS